MRYCAIRRAYSRGRPTSRPTCSTSSAGSTAMSFALDAIERLAAQRVASLRHWSSTATSTGSTPIPATSMRSSAACWPARALRGNVETEIACGRQCGGLRLRLPRVGARRRRRALQRDPRPAARRRRDRSRAVATALGDLPMHRGRAGGRRAHRHRARRCLVAGRLALRPGPAARQRVGRCAAGSLEPRSSWPRVDVFAMQPHLPAGRAASNRRTARGFVDQQRRRRHAQFARSDPWRDHAHRRARPAARTRAAPLYGLNDGSANAPVSSMRSGSNTISAAWLRAIRRELARGSPAAVSYRGTHALPARDYAIDHALGRSPVRCAACDRGTPRESVRRRGRRSRGRPARADVNGPCNGRELRRLAPVAIARCAVAAVILLCFDLRRAVLRSLDVLQGAAGSAFAALYAQHRVADARRSTSRSTSRSTGLSLPGAAVLTLAGGAMFGFWLGLICVVRLQHRRDARVPGRALRAARLGAATLRRPARGDQRRRRARRRVLPVRAAAGAGLPVLRHQPADGAHADP